MIDIQSTPVMQGVVMPGTWHYKEHDKMVIEEAESYVDLVNKLAHYRAVNLLPLGNPQADVDRYICTHFPNMCGGRLPVPEEGIDPIELSYGVPVKKTPRERVMQWAANRMQKSGQIEFVDSETSDWRASICNRCPMKRRWNEPIEGCPGCQAYVEEAESYLVRIRANKTSSFVLSLYGNMCDVAGHDLETACHLEEPALRHRRNYEGQFPELCWLQYLKTYEQNQ